MSMIYYNGSDGQVHCLGDDEYLKHYKYIKKIKSGNGWRYIYSQDQLKAYEKEAKDTWDYAKPQTPSTMSNKVHRDFRKEQDRWSNERERIRLSDEKLKKEESKMRKMKDPGKRFEERERLLKEYRKNTDSYMKNEETHRKNKLKNSNREYNLIRYKKIVNKITGSKSNSKKKKKKTHNGKNFVDKVIEKKL